MYAKSAVETKARGIDAQKYPPLHSERELDAEYQHSLCQSKQVDCLGCSVARNKILGNEMKENLTRISLLLALLNDNVAQTVGSIDFAILKAYPIWPNIR